VVYASAGGSVPTTEEEVTGYCPSGKKAMSGTLRASHYFWGSADFTISRSEPTAGGSAWFGRVIFSQDDAEADYYTVSLTVVCVNAT
jgi:hypothetical protein